MKDIDPHDVRVIYTRPNYLVLGPLGCFYVGQFVALPDGRELTVTSIDPDGAAVARSPEHVEMASTLPPNWRSQPCYDAGHATPRAWEGMQAQQARNRRECGVVLPC